MLKQTYSIQLTVCYNQENPSNKNVIQQERLHCCSSRTPDEKKKKEICGEDRELHSYKKRSTEVAVWKKRFKELCHEGDWLGDQSADKRKELEARPFEFIADLDLPVVSDYLLKPAQIHASLTHWQKACNKKTVHLHLERVMRH